MSGEVVRLVPNNALCVDHDGIADRLAALAERIRQGEFAGLERVIVLLDVASDVDYRAYGRQFNMAEFVGLLEFTKLNVLRPRKD